MEIVKPLISEKSKLVLIACFEIVKSILVSSFIALVAFPYIINLSFIQNILKITSIGLLIGLICLIVFFLVFSWQKLNNFWWRYKNTSKITPSKVTYVDFIFCVIYFSTILIAFTFKVGLEISSEFKIFLLFDLCLLIIYLFSAYLISLPKITKKTLSRQKYNEVSDEPIRFLDEDILNRGTFVRGLFDEITQLNLEESFVFGLLAKWGDGKTSALNLLRLLLAYEKDFIVINFDPWNFKDEEAMLNAFFETVEKSLNKEYLFPNLKKLFVKYQKLISSGLSNTGFKINFDFREDTVDEIKTRIEKYIENTNRKLIIIIDEIDRLQREEILMIFKLVRSNSKFKNSIFILSLDETKTVEKLGENGKEYLEKIVQKPVSLPKIEQNYLDKFILFSDHNIPKYIPEEILELESGTAVSTSGVVVNVKNDQLEISQTLDDVENKNIKIRTNEKADFKIGDKVFLEGVVENGLVSLEDPNSRLVQFRLSRIDQLLERLARESKVTSEGISFFDKEFSHLYRTHVSKLITNFRDAKRYLNSAYSSLPAIALEVCVLDFMLLEVLKVFGKPLYDDIFDNWWFYVDRRFEGDDFNNPLTWSFSKDTDKNKAVREHIDSVFKDSKFPQIEKDTYWAILKVLFPSVDRNSSITGKDRNDKRIFTTSFLKYFTLNVTSTELSDAFFYDELKTWKSSHSLKLIVGSFLKLQKAGKLVEFLNKLREVYLDDLGNGVIDSLVEAIYKNSKKFSKKGFGDFYDAEYDRALMLMLRILNTKIEKGKLQKLMENIIMKTPDLLFAVDLVLTTKHERGGDSFTIYDNVDNLILRQKLSSRLEKYLIKGKRDVRKEVPNNWVRITYQWGSNWSDPSSPNKENVTSYLSNLFRNDPKGLVDLLKSFNKGGFRGDDWGMNWEEYMNAYNLKTLASLAVILVKNKKTTSDEKEVLSKFILLSEEKSEKENKDL